MDQAERTDLVSENPYLHITHYTAYHSWYLVAWSNCI